MIHKRDEGQPGRDRFCQEKLLILFLMLFIYTSEALCIEVMFICLFNSKFKFVFMMIFQHLQSSWRSLYYGSMPCCCMPCPKVRYTW